MRALLTGMNGTVAPVVSEAFRKKGYEVIGYDRSVISTEDEKEIRAFLKQTAPDVLLHFAMGSNDWTGKLASLTREMNIRYVYISSVSVFGANQDAPFTKDMPPKPDDAYGHYKVEGEKASKEANPKTYIARLSWQIGHDRHNNHMVAQLYEEMSEKGVIEASDAFYPSAAFMEDTASGLIQMLEHPPGTYHLNTNHTLSFHDIVSNLKTLHPTFKLKKKSEPAIDVRMKDDTLDMPLLEESIGRYKNENR